LVEKTLGSRTSSAAGQELPPQLGVDAGRSADMLFADLDRLPTGKSPVQAAPSVERFPPIFMLVSAALAMIFAQLAMSRFPVTLVYAWAGSAGLVAILSLIGYRRGRRQAARRHAPSPRRYELLATLHGLVWAAMPAFFFDYAAEDMRIFGGAIAFAMLGIGSLAFSGTPAAAIIYCGLIAGSTSVTSLKLGGDAGIIFCAFSALYGLTVAGMVLNTHRREIGQRRIAGALQRQNDIIALLLDDFEQGASDWLWEAGPDFNLTYASPRLAQLLGIDEKDLAGLPLATLAGPESDRNIGWAEFRNRLEAHQVIHDHELEMPIAGRDIVWKISARPLFDGDGGFLGYRGVGRDVTIEKRALQDLVRAKDQAEKSNASKSHFLAVMSHELKTPLNAIVGFTELLASPQAEYLTEAARNDHLRTILDSSKHLQSLINDILDATRIEKGNMKLVEQEADAGELVEVAVKMCRDAAERADATIVARIVDAVEIRGDITRVKQILINLITNAVKFSSAGGFVYVGFEQLAAGGLAIAIRDSGFGIRPEDIAKVFEPFVQADEGMARRFGGIGLGLSIARKLARLHGGDVTLESDIGVGTTAKLILPAARVTWPAPVETSDTAVA
jgi:PAS domain S-box-containing protein